MRIRLISIACALASLFIGGSAGAGDYYDDGYYRSRSSRVWYSSDCCYKRVTRHSSYYVRTDDGYRSSYYDYPRHRHYSDYSAPRRYADDYYAPRHVHRGYYGGYSSYASDTTTCTWRRTPIEDGRGGWVWGARRVCY